MQNTLTRSLPAVFAFALAMTTTASAQDLFGPIPYLSTQDRPDGFCEECVVEDFEDNEIDVFLNLDCGEILEPDIDDPLIPGVKITDSVDGDDGSIDGSGNGGHSLFCIDPARSVGISFETPVIAAGAVWTDGDRGVSIQIEAFDLEGNQIAATEPVQVADDRFFGETEEDRFLGVRSARGISSITVSTVGSGAGIEIDHITWDAKAFEIIDTMPPTIDEVCSAVEAASENAKFDLNTDGVINLLDVDFAINSAGSLAGDMNGDGSVAFDDFLAFSSNFGMVESTYSQGDFDCDSTVAFGDFLVLSRNFGLSFEAADAAAVPEPSANFGLAIGMMVFVVCFRRRPSCQVGKAAIVIRRVSELS